MRVLQAGMVRENIITELVFLHKKDEIITEELTKQNCIKWDVMSRGDICSYKVSYELCFYWLAYGCIKMACWL